MAVEAKSRPRATAHKVLIRPAVPAAEFNRECLAASGVLLDGEGANAARITFSHLLDQQTMALDAIFDMRRAGGLKVL